MKLYGEELMAFSELRSEVLGMDDQNNDASGRGALEQARFRLRTPAGEVEVVGSEQFVERRWGDVQSALRRIGDHIETPPASLDPPEDHLDDALPTRKGAAKKRGGPSCASRILSIKEGGFFSSGRKAGDIVDKLAELATPYEAKHVAAALHHLTKTGRLRRLRGSDGDWSYIVP